MAVDGVDLHVVFLPFLTPSHTIPLVNAAQVFAARGVKATIISTRYNALLFQASVDQDIKSGRRITVQMLDFPAAEVGLPKGIENFGAVTSLEMTSKVSRGIGLLQKPMEKLIKDLKPDCIFSDMFFPWTVDLADELNIPRLLFYPSSFFYHCANHSVRLHTPFEKVQSESGSFTIPDLPDRIEMKGTQIPEHVKRKTTFGEMLDVIRESERRSYGVVHNTFYDYEADYAEHYRKIKGWKFWHIGPLFHFANRVSPQNLNDSDQHGCLSWLAAQKPNSVLFVCFGSMVRFSDEQLHEIAVGLEASNQQFVWVVRKIEKSQENEQEKWLPDDFEDRIVKNNRGMIIRGWAPQVKILNHPAIGGFLNHCGWNSVLEAVVAGVPLVTWPLFAEHFYNEKQVELLRIGVGVGSEVWNLGFEIKSPVIGGDKIAAAVTRLMSDSDEAEQIRRRVKEVAVVAKRAVREGGSSDNSLTDLIDELKACAIKKIDM